MTGLTDQIGAVQIQLSPTGEGVAGLASGQLLQRKPVRVVTVAAANRTARVAWANMTRGGTYRAPAAAAA